MTYPLRSVAVMLLLSACGREELPRPPKESLLTHFVAQDGLAIEAPDHTRGKTLPLQRLFISGHSLVDQPFPDQLSEIGNAFNRPLQWQRHNIPGSSIRDRSGLPGPEGHYDASLITEQHGVLGSLVWNDTVVQLRQWHDQMNSISPGATTFFYFPWLSIDNKDDPRRWIAYERSAAHIWQCIATRINTDLAQQGRSDRIVTIPANLAIAHLIEGLLEGRRLPGAELATVRDSIDSVVKDDVHLSSLGSYYIALVTYISMTGESAPVPSTSEQSRFLAGMAREFLESRARDKRAMTLAGCRSYIRDSFQDDYWDYARRSILRADNGALKAWWQAQRMRWRSAMSSRLLLE